MTHVPKTSMLKIVLHIQFGCWLKHVYDMDDILGYQKSFENVLGADDYLQERINAFSADRYVDYVNLSTIFMGFGKSF